MNEHEELLFEEYNPDSDKVLLSEVLDKLLNTGVVVEGDLIIGIADVDLLYVGVRALLTSVESLRKKSKSDQS
jgi:hypothetical protein